MSDILAFIRRWSRLILSFTTIGLLGGMSYTMTHPLYKSLYFLALSQAQLQASNPQKTINSGLIRAFSSSGQTGGFAKAFFSKLADDAKEEGPNGLIARDTNKYFYKLFGTAGGTEKSITDFERMCLGLSRYLEFDLAFRLRENSSFMPRGFLYQLDTTDGLTYRLIFQTEVASIAPEIIAATVQALDELIANFNSEQIRASEVIQQIRKEALSSSISVFESSDYKRLLLAHNREQATLLQAFYAVSGRVQALEVKHHVVGNREFPIYPMFSATKRVGDGSDVTDNLAVLQQLEENRLIQRITNLGESGASTKQEQTSLLDELAKIQAARAMLTLTDETRLQVYSAAMEGLKRFVFEASASYKAEEFNLPSLEAKINQVQIPSPNIEVDASHGALVATVSTLGAFLFSVILAGILDLLMASANWSEVFGSRFKKSAVR